MGTQRNKGNLQAGREGRRQRKKKRKKERKGGKIGQKRGRDELSAGKNKHEAYPEGRGEGNKGGKEQKGLVREHE